jgi:hypothetical protein
MEDRKLSKKELRERWYAHAKSQGRLERIKEQKPIRAFFGKETIVIEPLHPLYETTKLYGKYEEL